jgi:hypothetical protein
VVWGMSVPRRARAVQITARPARAIYTSSLLPSDDIDPEAWLADVLQPDQRSPVSRLDKLAPLELDRQAREVGGMSAELRVSYQSDDEWHGQLDVAVTSGAFSGKGSASFSREYLKRTFVKASRAFPLSTSDPPLIEGGFWSKERPRTLEQCHVRIAIRPYDARGSLLVQVDLASASWATPDKDQQQSVTARFLIEFAAMDVFVSHLEQVLNETREAAVLRGVSECPWPIHGST